MKIRPHHNTTGQQRIKSGKIKKDVDCMRQRLIKEKVIRCDN
jgi:hypothetical protein